MQLSIQSFSDIITNSSSEIFCTISGAASKHIYDILSNILPKRYYEEGPRIYTTDDEKVQIWMPYGSEYYEPFFKAGLEAIIEAANIPEKDYKINYEQV